MIKYSPYSISKSIDVIGFASYMTDMRFCTTRDHKILKFNETTYILSLSLDDGRTYPITLNLSGVCTIIQKAKIWTNGNISWCDQTHCYYSSDNLSTYHLASVKDIDGNDFTPATYDNFWSIIIDNYTFIGGTEIDVWGNYSIDAGTMYIKQNIWYSIDGGVTVKSCFKGQVTLGQSYRHCHGVSFNPVDNSFWMTTGDNMNGTEDVFWNKGIYNINTDSWSWTNYRTSKLGEDQIVGIKFYNGDAYFAGDGFLGVKKVPYANIDNRALDVWVKQTDYILNSLSLDENGIMTSPQSNPATTDPQVLYWSRDYGLNWTKQEINGMPLNHGFWTLTPKNSEGWIRADVWWATALLGGIATGKSVMYRIK